MTLVTANDDYDSSNTFEAYFIPRERWNGAAKPFFCNSEAERIAEDTAVNYPYGQQFRWNGNLDNGHGGWEYDVADDGPAVWNTVPTMVVDGVTYYQMGDGYTWHEITVDEYDDDATEDYASLVAEVGAAREQMANMTTDTVHYIRGNF